MTPEIHKKECIYILLKIESMEVNQRIKIININTEANYHKHECLSPYSSREGKGNDAVIWVCRRLECHIWSFIQKVSKENSGKKEKKMASVCMKVCAGKVSVCFVYELFIWH